MALIEMTPYAEVKCSGMIPLLSLLIIATLEEVEYLALKLNMLAAQPIKTALTYAGPVLFLITELWPLVQIFYSKPLSLMIQG